MSGRVNKYLDQAKNFVDRLVEDGDKKNLPRGLSFICGLEAA